MKHLLIIIACSLVWGCTEVSQLDSNAQVAISIVGPIAAVAGLLGFFYFVYKYYRE